MTLAEFRTRVRAYANDPSTSGTLGRTSVNELFAKAAIDELGGEVYKTSCNFLRIHSPGFFQKILVSATSSTQEHTWPSDFVRLIRMIVADDGDNLATDETNGVEIGRIPPGLADNRLAAGSLSGWVPQQGGFRLIPKVTTTGANALQLWYEYIPSWASTGSAVITWPDNHSSVLCVSTAIVLRETVGMNTQALAAREGRLLQALLIDLKTVDLGTTDQFPSSAFDSKNVEVSVHGTVG